MMQEAVVYEAYAACEAYEVRERCEIYDAGGDLRQGDSGSELLMTMSGERLHAIAWESFRVGNRAKLTLCSVLRVFDETDLLSELGYPSIAAYGLKHFGMGRSETLECIRVARALDALVLIRDAFREGRISWSVLKELSRVASEQSEEEWLSWAEDKTYRQVRAEVSDAQDKGRKTPRKEGFGLPGLDRSLVFKLRASDHEKVRLAFSSVAAVLSEQLGGEEVSAETVLLYLAERIREGGLGEIEERADAAKNPYAMIYQVCTCCRRGAVHTKDGLVEVSSAEIDRVAGDALRECFDEDLSIDRPTPEPMRRKVLMRDGHRCTNPHCERSAEQCHHIHFRSRGGPTIPENLTSVCGRCHALIHQGALTVIGRAIACGEGLV